ncbi:MAG: PIN domain-containing protein [Chloroflexi bacterium]|nr:PIN domain-containing protein [Chloroflexota bacterium]
MTEILIDTNVLVYAFDLAEPQKHPRGLEVVHELELSNKGCLSVQCLSEFIKATTRGASPILKIDEALKQAEDFIEAFPVFLLTPTIVLEAIRGVRDHQFSFYDAQIWACARLNQIPVIFSEDFFDGRTIEGVRFVNPFTETFELEKWA